MIRLDNTNRSIVLNLDSAITTNQAQIVASYSDNNGTTYVGGTQTTLSNSTTQVTLCAAPAASTVRDIDSVVIYNNDTVPMSLNIYLDDNGTLFQLSGAKLQTNETLIYTHAGGWETTDANGCLKTGVTAVTATNLTGPVALPNGITATTQSPGDNTTKLATDAFVTNAIATATAAYVGPQINQVTVNFGSQPINNGSFTITGSFTVGKQVMITQASSRPGSSYYDSIEFDHIVATGIVINSTTIQVNWSSPTLVANSWTFNYWVSS